ncbi:MAG TPA: hypothetical protein VMY18_00250 [Acidobacteriota bacterium]|nr:hypothetical protein [Acidobacteriota bacterium]
MSNRVGVYLIFAAFLTAYVGYEFSESRAVQAPALHQSQQIQPGTQIVRRTVVLEKGQLQHAGAIELSYGVVLLTSSMLLLSGLMLVWPSPRYEAV